MTVEGITQEIYAACFERGLEPKDLPCIFTGGEPLLQIDLPIILGVRNLGMRLHMETNGSLDAVRKGRAHNPKELEEFLAYFDELTISPKILPLSQDVFDRSTTLKVLVPSTEFPFSKFSDFLKNASHVQMKTLIIQPLTPAGGIDTWEWKANVSEAIAVAISRKKLYNENWRVIPQTHVLMKVR
jgi:organic radical activating enzyme